MLLVVGFYSLQCIYCCSFSSLLTKPEHTVMFPILLVTAFALLIRSSIVHSKKSKEVKAEDSLIKAESSSVQGVIHESASNIANVVKRGNKNIYKCYKRFS